MKFSFSKAFRFSRLLRRLKISSRIHLFSLILVGAMLSLGVTHLNDEQELSDAHDQRAKFVRLSHMVDEVVIAALQMRREEKDFLLFHQEKYLTRYKSAAARADVRLANLSALANESSLTSSIKRVRDDLNLLKNTFFNASSKQFEIGLNEKLGLHGKMRQAVHLIEDKLVTYKQDNLVVKMLMMRRHEKDFIMRDELRYVQKFDRVGKELKQQLKLAKISLEDKGQILAQLDAYEDSFHKLVKIRISLLAQGEDFNRIYGRMVFGLNLISVVAMEHKQEAVIRAVTVQAHTEKVFIISGSLILLVAIWFAQIVGKSITEPIIRQTMSMNKLAEGDTSIKISDTSFKDEIGDMARAIQVFRNNAVDRRRLQEAKRELHQIAYYDGLTGLANRAHCQEDLAQRLSSKTHDNKFALIQIDLDNFKWVNDTAGHVAGDGLLHAVGQRLSLLEREWPSLKAYRWGGDEFIVILGLDETVDVELLCRELTNLVSMPLEIGEATYRPTVSLGIACYPDDATDLKSLMIYSDLALYRTKELGRDGYQFFKPEMKDKIDATSKVERELRAAIKRDELELYFQPQIDIEDQTITGLEALLRWNHPSRGLILPDEFLPVVETSGMGREVGCLVFEKTMLAARKWIDQGFDFGRLAINLSHSHLKKGTFIEDLFGAMEKYNIDPRYIGVEFLESFLVDDPNENMGNVLRELQTRGIHVDLDDFGTGFASLSHMYSMPINGLKIDQTFIREMIEEPKLEVIVTSLISLSSHIGLAVVCEGIETQQQVDALSMINKCSLQGFYIAEPMSFGDMTSWISQERNIEVLIETPKIAATS